MEITYEWRGVFQTGEVERLHAEGFEHEPSAADDWRTRVNAHSLGWVCARAQADLVGFVNVAWDGCSHAFVLDTVVATAARRAGVGRRMVNVAAEHARRAGCEWLHVDFEAELGAFYLDGCGFVPTSAGLLRLRDS